MGRGRGRGGFDERRGGGPGGPGRDRFQGGGGGGGGGFKEDTTFCVPSDKCGLVIGKGMCVWVYDKRGSRAWINSRHPDIQVTY